LFDFGIALMAIFFEQLNLIRKSADQGAEWPLDHGLVGSYVNRRECHIEPDWLLIYKLEAADIIFKRTGSHSDLFK